MKTGEVVAAFSLAIVTLLILAPQAFSACQIDATGVNFGNYDPFAPSPTDSTGSVNFRCSQSDPITIFLSRGNAPTFDPRQMRNGGEILNYNLYRDAGRSSIWGDSTGGTTVYADPAPPRNQWITISIFGRIPSGQDVLAGVYTDSITATVNW